MLPKAQESRQAGREQAEEGYGGHLQAPGGILTMGRVHAAPGPAPAAWWMVSSACQAQTIGRLYLTGEPGSLLGGLFGETLLCFPKMN